MRYRSTRSSVPETDFTGALLGGLAPDGGLYVPAEAPKVAGRIWDYVGAVKASLEMFGADDVEPIVAEAARVFDHPEIAPVVEVGDRLVLELFWGPTLSFKDHALQVVSRLLARHAPGRTALVATSGDTGSAAIEACRGSLPIVVLFPEGRVAEVQRRQMTTVDTPGVTVVAVRGTFDDCQRMVKEAFTARPDLLAVNSINFARIAVQAGYYLYAASQIGEATTVVVPTGNFGNAYSAWIAARSGASIERIVVATNANRALADLLNGAVGDSAPVVATVAPAMDIQVPSNFERLPREAWTDFLAGWASDDEIRATIADVWRNHRYLLDPHTAAAWKVAGDVAPASVPTLVVATAHPAKFGRVVTEAIGSPPDMPLRLAGLAHLPERYTTIDAATEHLLELIG